MIKYFEEQSSNSVGPKFEIPQIKIPSTTKQRQSVHDFRKFKSTIDDDDTQTLKKFPRVSFVDRSSFNNSVQ